MCTQRTVRECLERQLFGSPSGSSNLQLLGTITPHATRLFLFNVTNKVLLGPYRASEPYALNLEPTAWATSGKKFPLQVRVYAEDHGRAYELPESHLGQFLHYTAQGKFQFRLDAQQAREVGDLLVKRGSPLA